MKFLGADYGVEFYLKPKWEKLKEGSIWSDAATQIFFSLSVSFGGLITMASYNEFEASVIRDTFIICLTNCFTSIFAGFGVFSFIGYLARKNCATIEQVNINQKLNDFKHAVKTNFYFNSFRSLLQGLDLLLLLIRKLSDFSLTQQGKFSEFYSLS